MLALLMWSLSVSAKSIILPEVLDLSQLELSDSADNIIVLPREGMTSYLFAEFPKVHYGNIDNKKIIDQYALQLEKSNWKKFDMGSFVEFEKQTGHCNLLLQLVDTAFANRVLASTKILPEGIYFKLNVPDGCDQELFHKKIIAQYAHVEVITEGLIEGLLSLSKPPAQAYGAVRQLSQVAEYSDSLSINDLIDFDSHLTLKPLKECHIESLFSAGYASKVACFIEDRSNYFNYEKLDETIVYDAKPYITSRAGMFFRKQGFQVLVSDSKEGNAGIEYDKISYVNNDLPRLVDAGFITEIYPEGCNIMLWLFSAKDDSPLWQGLAFKTIKVKSKMGKIEKIKMYEKLNYLVSITPMEGCK